MVADYLVKLQPAIARFPNILSDLGSLMGLGSFSGGGEVNF